MSTVFSFHWHSCTLVFLIAFFFIRPQDDGIVENFLIINCFSTGSFIWQSVIYFYLGLLLVAALILAFQTRKVKISVLNETKEMTIIVCVTAFISLQTLVFGFLLQDYNNVQRIFFNSGVFIVATSFLVFLYVPKASLPKKYMLFSGWYTPVACKCILSWHSEFCCIGDSLDTILSSLNVIILDLSQVVFVWKWIGSCLPNC